ncbi:hypothetical protein MJO29_012290 [Puccinia striiformis f. sp. tritici]|nr:hypothetical protein MJO29_012290 [Puccinia striiformis f. sp. tritici]
MQCISEWFSVDWSADSPNSALSVKPESVMTALDSQLLERFPLMVKGRNPTVEKVIDYGVVNQFDEYLRSPHSMIQGLLRHLNAAPCSVARAKFIVISCTNYIQNPPGF